MTNQTDPVEQVVNAYQVRILVLLDRCANACRAAGMYADEPADMCDDSYRWTFSAWRANERGELEDCIDVTLEIAEAREYGDEPETGINFGLDCVEYGGRVLGGLTPYNYTDQCWIDARDPNAVSERWAIMEAADVSELPALIRDN